MTAVTSNSIITTSENQFNCNKLFLNSNHDPLLDEHYSQIIRDDEKRLKNHDGEALNTQFFVKMPEGKTITLSAERNLAVESLMELINEREGVPVDSQRLVFGSKELRTGQSLMDYNIGSNSTLQLSLRLLGGQKESFAPIKEKKFVIDGIGGGLIVVDQYGVIPISVARIDIMTLDEPCWDNTSDSEGASNYLNNSARLTGVKCSETGLKVSGAAVLLYFDSKEKDTNENRKSLISALSQELSTFKKTSVLCVPGANVLATDLVHFFKEKDNNDLLNKVNMKSLEKGANPIHEEATMRRSQSYFGKMSLDSPTSSNLNQSKSNTDRKGDVVVQAAAYSSLGSITTLVNANDWTNPSIVLMGCTPLSCDLYWLLSQHKSAAFNVYMTDVDVFQFREMKIPSSAQIPWNNVFESEKTYDIVIFCSQSCPELDLKTIAKLQCNALLSLSDDFLPKNQEARERVLMELEKRNVFEALSGVSDLGGIAKSYSIAFNRDLSDEQAMELGSQVMRKKLHLHDIVSSDEQESKRKFHVLMLDAIEKDKKTNAFFGLGTVMHQSSDRMAEWMWVRAREICPKFRSFSSKRSKDKEKARYLDLGAGNGAAARFICKQHERIHVTCVDVCPKQSAENRNLSDEQGLGSQIDVRLGSFESLKSNYYNNFFDGCMSQEAFIHTFNKLYAFDEAFHVTKGGGWLLISDLFRGKENDDAEVVEFVKEQNISSWATPAQCVELAQNAGWAEVKYIDCTAEIKVSLQGLLQKVKVFMNSGEYTGSNLDILKEHCKHVSSRIGQADRGVYQWGIIVARKPYNVLFMSSPPATPEPNPMMNYEINGQNGAHLKFGTDVVVVNIAEKLPEEKIMALPSTTRLVVSLSAGLDHICVEAAEKRGIRIRRAARHQIVKSVADYVLSTLVFGLRNGFQNIGVPFPGKSWDLTWNASGIDLDCSKIGFIGMGAIATEIIKRIRSLSSSCSIVYHVPEGIRCSFDEGAYQTYSVGMAHLLSTCDAIIPMVPLTPTTTGLINYSAFSVMKDSVLFINMARGKVVDTMGLCRALREGLIRHAILDTTDPEPLPPDHELWNMKNCTITPHFATNTTYVRKELVEDVQTQVEDTLEEREILRVEEERMRAELSQAYRITKDFDLDELVWNHISVLLSDGSFLITPGCKMFDDISPQDLIKSTDNITAHIDILHESVYKARPDVKAIVHLTTPAAVAVSCLEMGFVPLAREAAAYIDRVAYLPWEHLDNEQKEQASISNAVKNKEINTMMMKNQGFCTFGRTLGEAWFLAYYFNKACQTQLNCLQTGQKINYPPEHVLKSAAERSKLPDFLLEEGRAWEQLRKMLIRKHRRTVDY